MVGSGRVGKAVPLPEQWGNKKVVLVPKTPSGPNSGPSVQEQGDGQPTYHDNLGLSACNGNGWVNGALTTLAAYDQA